MNRYLEKNTTLVLTKNKLFKPVVWFQACFFFHIRGLAAKTTYVIRNFRRFDIHLPQFPFLTTTRSFLVLQALILM